MKLELSNSMRLLAGEVRSTRAARDKIAAEAAELARRYREGDLVASEDVHRAEARAQAADAAYGAARRRFDDKRRDFAPRFLERQAEASAALRAALHEIAGRIDAAIADARAIDAFAVANSLPVTAAIGRVNRLARLAHELRTSN